MSKLYLIMCYSEDGNKFLDRYGVYQTKQRAVEVCQKNNDYKAHHHPNDDIIYKVQEVISERECIW